MNPQLRWSLALAFALGFSSAQAQTYVVTDLSATNAVPMNYAPTAVNGISSPYQVGSGITNNQSVALLWQGSAASVLNLTPSGYQSAAIYGLSTSGSVGYGATIAGQTQALLWPGRTPSVENLNPVINGTNAIFSEALGTSGSQIVGEGGASSTNAYAVLWSTPGTTVIDLHPSGGYATSAANATDGRQQVGYATTNGLAHAFIWSGGPDSAQDLNPGGYMQSFATAVAPQVGSTNSVAVGYAETSTNAFTARAYVWPSNGATNYPVSLHPSSYTQSFAYGVSGTNVVGYGLISSSGPVVALLWHGFSTNSIVNLDTYLPSGATNAVATCIDASGNIGGYAMVGNQTHAILWQPATAPVFTSTPLNVSTGLGIPYLSTFTASGLPAPTFSLPATNAPPGITLFSTGTLSGTPTATGTYSGTVMASNGISPTATQNFSITVVPTPTTKITTLGNFVSGDGYDSFGPLCQDASGNFYDTAYDGGTASFGTLFEMQTTGSETLLHSFRDNSVTNDGGSPTGIVVGPNGAFYGTTAVGGTTGNGTIFSYSSGTVSILHNFQDGTVPNDGSDPQAPLLLANDGYLYGTTSRGGTTEVGSSVGYGTVFKTSPQGTVTILHNFHDGTVTNDGFDPSAPLIQGSDGYFYGTTYEGGSPNTYGSAFRMTPSGSVTLLHGFFDGTVPNDGRFPVSGLTEGIDGAFYGITANGGTASKGIIYRLTSSGQYSILRNIGDGTVADDIAIPQTTPAPQQNLVLGPDGNLYGVTNLGGSANEGALFMITPTGTMVVLHSFGDGSLPGEGTNPSGSLILAADGNYYGPTLSHGTASNGTVFKFSVSSAPVLTFGTPPTATAGQEFDYAFIVLGSPAPTFSVSGNLPPGLLLSSNGVLSGTPTAIGAYTFTFTARNGVGNAVTQTITITIVAPATDTPVMPPWGLALLAAFLVVASILKPPLRTS